MGGKWGVWVQPEKDGVSADERDFFFLFSFPFFGIIKETRPSFSGLLAVFL